MKQLLCMLLLVTLLLCACTTAEQAVPTDDSSVHMQTETESAGSQESIFDESEFYKNYWEMVNGILDASRPAEAYQFPTPSGEITDVRVTVRERDLDLSFRGLEGHKAYEIYYGYYSNGKWYDYPSTNYELRDLVDTDVLGPYTDSDYDSYDVCDRDHIVEIGPYYLIALPTYPLFNSMKFYDISIQDTLNSEIIMFTEYFIPAKSDYELTKNLLFFENMRAYGTEDYLFHLEDFVPMSFVIVEKEAMTEEYLLTFEEQWANPPHKQSRAFSYDEIMGALNR